MPRADAALSATPHAHTGERRFFREMVMKLLRADRKKQNRDVLALIPARGGSKGIPGKNLADLDGKPLIAHSILAALNCRAIDRVVVTTDSPAIAEEARRWGAEAPFLRPAEFSHDTAALDDVIGHALQTLRRTQGYEPMALVMLFPTHPFRTRELMDHLTGKLLEGYHYVRTMRPMAACARSHLTPGPAGGVTAMDISDALASRRFFRGYGLYSGNWLREGWSWEFYIHPVSGETELLDIDEPRHLARANELAARWSPEEGDRHGL